ncbi:gibberellin-regulated protein 11-like isoform X2 [Andrographis paniculata]|uniref:gibberellin-regulated protein 11-like isoform X2 n=1 Tax=Andrographis paniculata TaxID=175694 RepID=UPI0021E7BEAD|nr:gibberellin-regulated protein 11-like isoform X2 [Andrographis paniculata]
MPISKHTQYLLVLASFLFLLLLVEANHDDEVKPSVDGNKGSYYVPKMGCGAACRSRCRLSSRPNLCNRACGTCCSRCKCVPPGTSGNQQLCPCYYTLTTHGGRRKCP